MTPDFIHQGGIAATSTGPIDFNAYRQATLEYVLRSSCFVFFRSGACTLQLAEQELQRYKLNVRQDGNDLLVGRPGAPVFRITLTEQPHVRREAKEIARGTEHEGTMGQCDARFEITIDDLEQVLEEINTLMEVQGALQDASSGYLFLPWNGLIAKPWVTKA